ncbi:MAG: DUF6263 family protein [Pirellulaceae bacterium]|nr:DUF6263 family protein [Pirellulaceae bacterium]
MYCRVVIAVAVVACSLLHVPTTAAQTLLRWRFEQGQRLRVAMVQSIDTETFVDRKPLAMGFQMNLEMDWEVVGVDQDGAAQMTQSIRRMSFISRTPKEPPVEYDTEKKPINAAGRAIEKALRPLVDAKFHLKLSARGEVVDVQLSAEVEKAMENFAKESRYRAIFSREGMSKTLRHAAAQLPENPVSAGDSWTTAQAFASPIGDASIDNQFTYRGVSEGRQVIDVKRTMKVKESESKSKTRLASFESSGSISFDSRQGRLAHSKINQTIKTERPFRDTKIEVVTKSVLEVTVR